MNGAGRSALETQGAGLWAYARTLAGAGGREALEAAVAEAGADAPIEQLRRELRLAVAARIAPQPAGVRARLGARSVCADIPLVLAGRLSGELSDADEDHLAEHLAGCGDCSALAQRVHAAERLLETDGPAPAWLAAPVAEHTPMSRGREPLAGGSAWLPAGAAVAATAPAHERSDDWILDEPAARAAVEFEPSHAAEAWTAGEQPPGPVPTVAQARPRRRRLPRPPVAVVVVACLAVAAGALALGGVFDSGRDAEQQAAAPTATSPDRDAGERDDRAEARRAERRERAERRRRAAARRRATARRRAATAAPAGGTGSTPVAQVPTSTTPPAQIQQPQQESQPQQQQAPRQPTQPTGGDGETTAPPPTEDEPGREPPGTP